ncbi:Uncharacterised protein [Mycobacteroides abscessus subsp. bolletii]|uniref:hypothetical protein n=1 Tax=Mycobacteroides abscessus TaxID=36809 RepID=UPI0009CCBD36|nr:hypothetical protein [Mycobacteroides abscessus]SLD50621.1 Uncharacterised protein [Mycobacteroides abscessus subsp. bolletii]
MSKVRKSRHRVPTLAMTSDPIDERYQAEIDTATNRLERRYRRAQCALQKAQARAQRALQLHAAHPSRANRDVRDGLQVLVERRRAELHEIELLMLPTNYAGRDARRRRVRHETAAITIPLGATAEAFGHN